MRAGATYGTPVFEGPNSPGDEAKELCHKNTRRHWDMTDIFEFEIHGVKM
jgi:hypothetical protein